ncbi:hypothetical protein ACN28I_40095 [Archangium gephyra]|uniref:hypothetical protein n=1 Tax=Archangium gephyra TaxID=48 RepID=UPI003B7E9B3B
MPTQQQKITLIQLKLGGDSNYLSVTPDVSQLPEDVSKLLNLPSAEKLREELSKLSDKVTDDALSNASTLAKDKGFYKLHNWASGGSPFRRFKDDEITKYFEELFESLVGVSASLAANKDPWFEGDSIALNRADLFHGHLVYDTSAPLPDILLLFHAKEYPSDIEEFKSNTAKLLEPQAYKEVKTSSKGYKYRCSIYSLRFNKLWILRLSDNNSPYRSLVNDPNLNAHQNPLRIDQDDLGECVSDINYFPNDGVPLFFCLRPRSS